MTTFDYAQVKDFAAAINAQLDQCENGEGMQCDTIDSTLSFCAERCCKFADEIRQWGLDVFAGRVAFDAAAEQLWQAELSQLFNRAIKLLAIGKQAESDCYILDGRRKLEAALWNLNQLMAGGWVTPKIAVGPSARHELSFDAEDVQRIEALEPLPADWKPNDPRQAAQLRWFRGT